jgi:hypothetical protein
MVPRAIRFTKKQEGEMIQTFIDRFEARKEEIRATFTLKQPTSYEEIVKAVVRVLADDGEYETPDPERIHSIDDGDYQGTLVFVIAGSGCQPSAYWYVKVSYGSCSGCDTLEAIHSWNDEPPTKEQLDDYMTLALHIVQGIKKMGDD